MEPVNQNAYATAEQDRVIVGLGPKQNPTTGNRRAALPRDAGESTVSTPNDKPGKRRKNTEPTPAVSDDVIRKVRRGATVAMLLAAGISARTLFQLGEIIGLPKQFAWMLPGAFDVYAYTSATVAAAIPAAHSARAWAVWNARIALGFTMIGNALVHALFLMSNKQGWTGTDYALTAVSAIPPIIVERLLHLQTKIAADAPSAAPAAATGGAGKMPDAEKAATTPKGASAATPATTPPPAAPAPAATRATASAPDGNEPPERDATVVPINGNGRRSAADWAKLALPPVRAWIKANPGAELTGPIVGRLLREAHPDLPVPGGVRSERNIRAAVEELLDGADDDSERAEAVS